MQNESTFGMPSVVEQVPIRSCSRLAVKTRSSGRTDATYIIGWKWVTIQQAADALTPQLPDAGGYSASSKQRFADTAGTSEALKADQE